MSLSGALTAYAELVGDTLVNECGVPTPRVLRYHGHAAPEEVDCSNGILSVWWTDMTSQQQRPCQGPLQVVLHAKYVTCWKLPEIDSEGVTLLDDTWDGDAAVLADVAECVARVLGALACPPDDPLARALLELTVGTKASYLGSQPSGAAGAAAGVQWNLQCLLAPTLAETS